MSGKPPKTQRILVPGQNDRISFKLIGRQSFDRMAPGQKIWLGRSAWVLRGWCFWSERESTISLLPEIVPQLDQLTETDQTQI